MGKVYVGDEGTILSFDVGANISGALTLEVEVKKPDATTHTWTATLESTSVLRYVIQTGDLDQAGTWKFQAKVTRADGTWLGETVNLRVYAPYT